MIITPSPTVRFLDALSWTPDMYRALWIKSKHPWTMWFTERAALLEYLATHNGSYHDVYVSVGLCYTKRGPKRRPEAEDIGLLPGFWADLDLYGEAHKGKRSGGPSD